MSFLTLGIFWAGQQTQLNHIGEGTRDLTWIHLGFLFAVTLLPLSTRLLAEFITSAAPCCSTGSTSSFSAPCSIGAGHTHAPNLVKNDTPNEVRTQHLQAILTAQSLYAVGAALCVINTWVGIDHRVGPVELRARPAAWWRKKER